MNLEKAILLTVTYADIFNYPLTVNEMHRYLIGQTAAIEEVYASACKMASLNQVGIYFHLSGRGEIIACRERRARASALLWQSALAYKHLLAQIPYVRMLAITGSLAVNNSDQDDDIDLLVVTDPGRLWMCRAMMMLVVRYALLRGVRLCANYLVSTRSLEFPDKNLYAAHELAQMVPLTGLEIYDEIWRQNAWVQAYLPNASGALLSPVRQDEADQRMPLRAFLEAALRHPAVDRVESWEMNRKIARFSREQRGSLESGFSADYCKGHAHRHQQRTGAALAERLKITSMEAGR